MDDKIKETIDRVRDSYRPEVDARALAYECERLQAEIDAVAKDRTDNALENTELRSQVAELEGKLAGPPKMICMWCHTDTTDWPSERVRDHIFGCEKAPHAKLYTRLSEYECPQHPEPKFGECDECDKHAQDEEWRNPQL